MSRKQCKKCPWRVDVDPLQIPGEYCEDKHAALSSSIALPGVVNLGALHMMACHETPVGKEKPCVGWMVNQLGVGNNIALRLAVATGRIDARVETVGEQHATLEETLPSRKCRR